MSLFSRLRAPKRAGKSPETHKSVTYAPIGVVRNSVSQPRPDGWETLESEVVLRDGLIDALDAIEGFSHVIIVFHLDQVPEKERRLRVAVGNEESPPERGVLATRSQRRPNAIGVSVVELLGRSEGTLRVRGLDALDGSPVLDLKPYLPEYDAVSGAVLPAWATR